MVQADLRRLGQQREPPVRERGALVASPAAVVVVGVELPAVEALHGPGVREDAVGTAREDVVEGGLQHRLDDDDVDPGMHQRDRARPPHDAVVPHRAPDVAGGGAQAAHRVARRGVRPQPVEDLLGVHGPAGMQREQAEQVGVLPVRQSRGATSVPSRRFTTSGPRSRISRCGEMAVIGELPSG